MAERGAGGYKRGADLKNCQYRGKEKAAGLTPPRYEAEK
jgi:hypothetical protein